MPQDQIDASAFSPDMYDFLLLLAKYEVQYLIVGGEAVIYYGYARLTGDVDIFYARDPANADRLYAAFRDFWGGPVPNLSSAEDLLQEGMIVQFGVPPNRLDLINTIDGVTFEEAWKGRHTLMIAGPKGQAAIHYIGLDALIRNKHASGRPKDLDDLRYLERR